MREVSGDLFSYHADAIVIPTNTQIRYPKDTDPHLAYPVAVMGAGLAKQAAEREPELPAWLGERISQHGGEHVYVYTLETSDGEDPTYYACLPTKCHWKDRSSLGLITDMVHELRFIARAMAWELIALPRLGCGLGGLRWEDQVRPLLLDLDLDDRFVIVHPGDPSTAAL